MMAYKGMYRFPFEFLFMNVMKLSCFEMFYDCVLMIFLSDERR